MELVLLARNPTDSVTDGLLPAAARAGLDVRVLTDDPAAHRAAYAAAAHAGAPRVEGCAVTEVRAVLAALTSSGARPVAVASNSDHLQTQTALVAGYLGLPGKDWRSALRARDKGLMRAHLHAEGLDDTVFHRLTPAAGLPGGLRYPVVLKPAEGVASEDVVLVEDDAGLARRVAEVRSRRPGADLLVETLLEGTLHTLETLGDGAGLRVWGGWRTRVSAAPHFVEERLTWDTALPAPVVAEVLTLLRALGVGFGPCHTEFVLTPAGPRLVEVNDRLIGDHCDFAMADLLGEPVFDQVVAVYRGEPAPGPAPAPAACGFVHWVLADRDGVLRSAPGEVHRVEPAGGVRLDYRPMRAAGSPVRVTGTNRDYLGALRVTGPSEAAVEAAAGRFLAAERWVIG